MKALKTQSTMTQENLLYLNEVVVLESIATKITRKTLVGPVPRTSVLKDK